MSTEKRNINKLILELLTARSQTVFKINNLGYLPRWVVLLLDVVVISFSFLCTFYLFNGLSRHYFETENWTIVASIYFGFSLIYFWWFKTYAGIIRHSSFIDAIKIFIAQGFIFLSVFVVNIFSLFVFKKQLLLNSALLINTVLAYLFLFFYRVLVKQIFEMFMRETTGEKLINALVYGADANAISVTNALISETPSRFKIRGFIDKYNTNDSKRILNLPILSQRKKVSVLMRNMKVDALIIADKGLSNEEKISIVDDCLEHNYKVYTVPIISDWENEVEISKKIKTFQIEDLLDRKPIVLDKQIISDQLKNNTVLVTGAAGSIGSEIVRQIVGFGPKRILLLDQAETPLHDLMLQLQNYHEQIEVIPLIADVRDMVSLENIFENYHPNLVYHAAAYKHVPLMEENPSQAIFVNVCGTKNLADLSVKYGVERFVMVSTDKAVNPSNVMGASKRIAEKYVQSFYFNELTNSKNTTKFITTRFGNVLGSNGSVVPLFTKQINEGGPVTITHKDIIRYFMTIPEACQLVLEAGAMGNGGEIYIFDMGKPVKIYDLAIKMIRLAGFVPEVDIKVKEVGLRPGEKLYEELLNDSSKTLPTHHEKIMIAQEIIEDYADVNAAIGKISRIASEYKYHALVQEMKILVPEFKSLNSIFEILDKQ
ncbi:polysaccharide biosynthesis protein [Flavobacterium sp.]|uniref:polysaccharide biosynthesis protein n=1 Tax=Flavobacterium sp. TaxID=239 RepID=UPI003D0C595A